MFHNFDINFVSFVPSLIIFLATISGLLLLTFHWSIDGYKYNVLNYCFTAKRECLRPWLYSKQQHKDFFFHLQKRVLKECQIVWI